MDKTNVAEPVPQSFIIKVWIEETAEEAGRATWRGYITHVPCDVRHPVNDLDDIRDFIVPYLEEMGVKVGRQNHLGPWLKRARFRLRRSLRGHHE